MKKFLLKISGFFLFVVLLLVLSLFYIPDVTSKDSLLGALVDKHQMVMRIKEEKIIFIGGSNVSFGLDSKRVYEEFKKPVINMGVHAGMGLEYIVNDIKPYIQKGDVVVLMPEYENFYTDNFYGEMELVSVIFDINPNGKNLVDEKQWTHLFKYLPTYSAKKMKSYVSSFFNKKAVSTEINIYDRRSFNEFGDAYIHWALPDQNFLPCKVNSGGEDVNPEVISFLQNFGEYVKTREAKLILLPPVIESESFENQKSIIDSIEIDLRKSNVGFSSKPIKYKFPVNYFFNSIYHPNKKGVDLRTQLVIDDLNAVLTNTSFK